MDKKFAELLMSDVSPQDMRKWSYRDNFSQLAKFGKPGDKDPYADCEKKLGLPEGYIDSLIMLIEKQNAKPNAVKIAD